MISKQWLFTNMFLRNMLADFGKRSADSNSTRNFIPYFQYRIGNYQPDYYLYFPKEPFITRYKNEVFNKLQEYCGYDLIRHLEFHYTAYTDKVDFIRFLQYEITERTKKASRKVLRQKLHCVREWLLEKKAELSSSKVPDLKQQIEQEVREIIGANGTDNGTRNYDALATAITQKLSDHIDRIMTSTEEQMQSLTGSFITGQVDLNNYNHQERLIQLFKLLQTIQAPPQIAKGEQLFKKFSDTDMTSILLLHFTAFKGKKLNTVQVKIREADERLNPSNAKVKKLTEALQEFFY